MKKDGGWQLVTPNLTGNICSSLEIQIEKNCNLASYPVLPHPDFISVAAVEKIEHFSMATVREKYERGRPGCMVN